MRVCVRGYQGFFLFPAVRRLFLSGYKALLKELIRSEDCSICVVVFVGLTFLTGLRIYSNTRVRMGMYTYVLIWGGYG